MKQGIILLLATICLNSFGRVLINKGPVFNFPKNAGIPQQVMAELYVPSRVLYMNAEALRAANKARKAKKIDEEMYSRFRSIREYEADHVDNVIAFNYKDEEGEYEDWGFLKIKWGLCTGYSTALRKFHYLAFFDPTQEAPVTFEEDKKEWRKFYKNIIDDIMDNEPRVIPGFSNLKEFSDSEMAYYFQRHLADQWAVQNVGPGGVKAWLRPGNEARWEKKRKKIIKELRWLLARNFEPVVYWGAVMFESSHVVRVVDLIYVEENDSYTMKYLDTDGVVKYEEEVYNIFPLSYEKANFVDMARNLEGFCEDNPEVCDYHL